MRAGPLPTTVNPAEYATVEAILDDLLESDDDMLGYDISFDGSLTYARYRVVLMTTRGDCIGVGPTLLDASRDATDMWETGPSPYEAGSDEPEAY